MIEQQTQQQTQSQSHGFIIENDIREKCFGLEYENNNTDRHDIPKEKTNMMKMKTVLLKQLEVI